MRFLKKPVGIAVVLIILAAVAFQVHSYRRSARIVEFARECSRLAGRGHWKQLEEQSSRWIAIDSDSPIAGYWNGLALQRQQRHAEALSVLERIPLQGPRGIDAASKRMEILFHALHRPLDAIQLGDEVLKADPAEPEARRERIYFCAMTLRRGELLQHISEAIESGVDLPEHYAYLIALDDLFYRDGPEVVGRWCESHKDDVGLENALLVQRAQNRHAEKLTSPNPESLAHYEVAEQAVQAAHAQSRNDPRLLGFLMLTAHDRGDTKRVGELLTDVSDSAASDPVLWRYRGWYAMQNGDLEDAEFSLQQALELHPLSWQTRHLLANLRRLQQRPDEAKTLQELGAQGTELLNSIRRVGRTRNLPRELLLEFANYALDCGDSAVANAVFRRMPPG